MATAFPKSANDEPSPKFLRGSDRMTQAQFHRAYESMPEGYRAELIGGVVHEPSPLGYLHATSDAELLFILKFYAHRTPGTVVAGNASVFLSDEDEVQPDAILRLDEKHGGQSRIVQIGKVQWIKGAPELVAEVAQASRNIDLGIKKERYRLAGVLEYIVVCLEPSRIYWFDLCANRELKADADGIFRSCVFPGLWVHSDSLLQFIDEKYLRVLKQGLKSKEHAEFLAKISS